jgi:hypothetical protein
MLKVLHNHIFASKLRDVFATSPLVLVYQTIGSVDAAAAASKLQAQLDAALPAAGLRVRACRMRNSVAAGAGESALARLFQASNLLVGFGPAATAAAPAAAAAAAAAAAGPSSPSDAIPSPQPPGGEPDGVAAAAVASSSGSGSGAAAREGRAVRADTVQALIGSLFGAPAAGGDGGPRQLAHKELAKAFQLAAALPEEQPLVLLGAFYGRESIQLRHLKEWVALDERKVGRWKGPGPGERAARGRGSGVWGLGAPPSRLSTPPRWPHPSNATSSPTPRLRAPRCGHTSSRLWRARWTPCCAWTTQCSGSRPLLKARSPMTCSLRSRPGPPRQGAAPRRPRPLLDRAGAARSAAFVTGAPCPPPLGF